MSNNDPDFTQTTETSEKSAQIQKWLTRHAVRLSTVGASGAVALTLPALALAQSGEQFVLVSSIDGVTRVAPQADGSLLLQTANGQTITVNAQNVQVLASGEIAISQSAAVLVTEAAGMGMAAISPLAALAGGVAAVGAVAVAADSGSGSSVAAPKSLNLAEIQGNGLSSESLGFTAPEGTNALAVTIDGTSYDATLNADGSWTLPLSPAQAGSVAQGLQTVKVSATDSDGEEIGTGSAKFDIDTQPPSLTLDALPVGTVMNTAERGADLTVSGTTNAENGQVVTVTLNGTEYTATVADGTFSVTVPQADLAALADDATVSVTAKVSDAAGNPAPQATVTFDTDFTAPTVALDAVAGGSLDLGDAQGDLAITGTTTAEDGQTVTVKFAGTDYTGTVSGGTFSVTVPQAALQAVVDRPGDTTTVDVTASVSDAAGNVATPVTVTVPGDFSGPSIVIDAITGDDALNAGEVGSEFIISGTTGNVLTGAPVTLDFDGTTYSATVQADGSWSVTIPDTATTGAADGTIAVTANVSEGGIAAPTATTTLVVDTAAPTIAIDTVSVGTTMNIAEQGMDLTISGSTSAEDQQSVTIKMGAASYTTTAQSGAFSLTIPAADLTGLADGATIAITADVSDKAGNAAPQASSSFDTDLSAPTLNFTDLPAAGEVVNAADLSVAGTLEGTTNAEDGTAVQIQIAADDGTVVFDKSGTVTGGAFSVPTTPAELSVLQDGQTYTMTATATDLAGNTTSQSGGFTTDLTAPTLAFDAPPSGGTLTALEAAAGDLVLTGTSDAEDGQIVTLSVAGTDYTAPVDGGVWSISIPSGDLQALIDGDTVPFALSVEDAAGNPATATSNVVIDFAPVLTLNQVGTNDAVFLNDVQDGGLSLSGGALGMADGTAIDIAVGGESVGSTTATGGSWSFNVPSSSFKDARSEQDATVTVSSAGATSASESLVIYDDPAYLIQEIGRDGTDVTYGLYLSPGTDFSKGVSVSAPTTFDPAVFQYGATIQVAAGFLIMNEEDIATGEVTFGLISTTPVADPSQPVLTFTGTLLNPDAPVEFNINIRDGSSDTIIGTDDADVVAGLDDVFTIIRPGGGDDSIDLSAAGTKLIQFEADPSANGTDTIANFTGGEPTGLGDVISFVGLTPADLRGDGTGQQTLAENGALDANTGLVTFTTQLGGLSAINLADAAETLQGEAAGDAFYIIASDGTDAALAKITFAAPDDASAEIMATFTGLSDTTGFNADSIIFPELSAAYT